MQATLGSVVGTTVHPEPTVEIYSRIARGALTCWFGANGSLKKTHIFHADVAPPSAGGQVEIVVHERDGGAQSPRSLRAYRVSIVPSGDGSHVTIENLKFAEPMATHLKEDVVRWATGKAECSVIGVGGWGSTPTTGEPPPAAKPKVAKKKR